MFFVFGGLVQLFQPWTVTDILRSDHRWTIDELVEHAANWGDVHFDQTLVLE